jgi:hypothetical protein
VTELASNRNQVGLYHLTTIAIWHEWEHTAHHVIQDRHFIHEIWLYADYVTITRVLFSALRQYVNQKHCNANMRYAGFKHSTTQLTTTVAIHRTYCQLSNVMPIQTWMQYHIHLICISRVRIARPLSLVYLETYSVCSCQMRREHSTTLYEVFHSVATSSICVPNRDNILGYLTWHSIAQNTLRRRIG